MKTGSFLPVEYFAAWNSSVDLVAAEFGDFGSSSDSLCPFDFVDSEIFYQKKTNY